MKLIFTFIFCIVSLFANAQWGWNTLTFEPADTFYGRLIVIDTAAYAGNIWQVGQPHKAVFDSGYLSPNAIVTDTVNPYPINDTSVFILKIPRTVSPFAIWPGALGNLSFYYQLDIDSGAIAMVEISSDSGHHWTNLNDSLPPSFYWSWGPKPRLDTSSNGWQVYNLDKDWWAPGPDTFQFRFTFITDSVFAGKDGWIIDNISTQYDWEGAVHQVPNNNLISLYPNPTKGNIYLHTNKPQAGNAAITIYDMQGKEVYKTDKVPPNNYLNLQLPDGVYMLRYATDEEYCVKRMVIMR